MEKVIMTSSYLILKEQKLVIDIYDGILTLNNFKGHKLKQVAEKDFSPDYNLLSDFTSVEVRMSMEDVKEYAEFVAKRGGVVGNRKAAVVVNNPNQFVYATTYDKELHTNKVGQELISFISFDEAFEWLGLEDSKEDILALIKLYRRNPLFEWTIENDKSYF